ncbi:MAG: PQQ-binding-like beta-propeller repeat protein, partial [Vicinamibacterales bacterium]|nr:PQQ-binding-like beta-propeller repeat protein [Vicinamibacterales bacterium]
MSTAGAQEIGMFGNTPSRNMVSGETGVPESWDPSSGTNVLWTQPVGSQAYGGPTVANGKVYVGTNNEGVRNPAYEGDKGVLMAFDAASGDFAWQMVHDKLSAGRVNDWPLQGVCSTAFAEGDKVWYVSNQAHVVCLDANGLANGNDGPFTDETGTGPTDGDILWSYDMIGELDVFPHNLATGSPVIVGDVLFTVTSNGV